MPDFEDLVKGLVHVTIMAVASEAGRNAQRSFVDSSERRDAWGMFLCALAIGGAAYGFQWSSLELNRLVKKRRMTSLFPAHAKLTSERLKLR